MRAANVQPRTRAAASNDPRILDGVDGRKASARRFRDLVNDISANLGGVDTLSSTDLMLVRQAAALTLRTEKLQSAIVLGELVDDDHLVRISGELRRVLGALFAADQSEIDDPLFFPERLMGGAKSAAAGRRGR